MRVTHVIDIKEFVRKLQDKAKTGYQILLALHLKNVNYLTAAQALIDVGYEVKVQDGIQFPDEDHKILIITDDNGKEKIFIWYFQAAIPSMTQDRRPHAPKHLPRWVKATTVKVNNDGYLITYKKLQYKCNLGEIYCSGTTLRYVTVYDPETESWLNIEFEFTPAAYV